MKSDTHRSYQTFIFILVPNLAIRAQRMKIAAARLKDPAQDCRPTQLPWSSIVPAIGLPISNPSPHALVSMPSRVPMVSESSDKLKTMGAPNDTKVPEKKPSNTLKTTRPVVFLIPIQQKVSTAAAMEKAICVFMAPA